MAVGRQVAPGEAVVGKLGERRSRRAGGEQERARSRRDLLRDADGVLVGDGTHDRDDAEVFREMARRAYDVAAPIAAHHHERTSAAGLCQFGEPYTVDFLCREEARALQRGVAIVVQESTHDDRVLVSVVAGDRVAVAAAERNAFSFRPHTNDGLVLSVPTCSRGALGVARAPSRCSVRIQFCRIARVRREGRAFFFLRDGVVVETVGERTSGAGDRERREREGGTHPVHGSLAPLGPQRQASRLRLLVVVALPVMRVVARKAHAGNATHVRARHEPAQPFARRFETHFRHEGPWCNARTHSSFGVALSAPIHMPSSEPSRARATVA